MRNRTNTDRVGARSAPFVFVEITYALSIALSLVIGLTGGYQSRWIGLGYISMLIPSIAVLITNSVTHESARLTGWNRFPLRYLPVALFLMPAVLHAAMLTIAWFMGRIHWQEWLTPQADGLYHTPAARGWGILTATGLAGRIAANAVVGLIVVSMLALFEEVGWRAWLLPRLMNRMGARRAVVVASIIWAFWHTPYALSGIQHIDGVPPALTAAVMPIGIAGSGLVLGWLWLRTRSIWIVAVAHGALNNWGQYAFKFMAGPGELRDGIVLGAGGVALLAVGSLLLLHHSPAGVQSNALSLPRALPGATADRPSSVGPCISRDAGRGNRRWPCNPNPITSRITRR